MKGYKTMLKPLVIKIKEAKANISESVNAARHDGLPFYLLEPIIADLHTQISNAAQKELEQAQKQFAEAEAKQQAEQEQKGADTE